MMVTKRGRHERPPIRKARGHETRNFFSFIGLMVLFQAWAVLFFLALVFLAWLVGSVL